MASLLAEPQPRDGTWLSPKKHTNTRRAPGDQTCRRRQRQNGTSFLRTAADDGGGAGQEEDISVELDDVTLTSVKTPHTIENLDNTAAFAPADTRIDTAQHHFATAAGGSNYTSQTPLDTDNIAQPPMPPKKFLPPHLARKKVASNIETTEKSASTAEASAISQTGGMNTAAPLRPRNAARHRGNGNRNGACGRGFGNSFAEARAQIPKVDPKRHQTDWNPRKSWDSSSVDSGRASSGWGTKKKRAGHTASPPAADWSGKLAPPPPDWDSRPGFRAEQSYTKIMDWMSEIEHEMCAVPDTRIPLNDVTGADGTTYVFSLSTLQPDQSSEDLSIRQMGEIVPRFWTPIVISRQAPQTFWMELVASHSPMPDEPIDLEGAKPWWERFVKGENSCLNFLKDPPIPLVMGIDPEQEDADQKLKRKHDKGSSTHAENRRRYELERQQEKVDKKKQIAEKHRKLAAMDTTSNTPTNPNRVKPGYKLFIRSARAEDMGAVKDVYNYHIENSTAVPEMERRSKEEMVARYRDIRLRKMPFLVAFKPGVVIKAPRNKKKQANQLVRDDVQLPDTIVGFAFADDYMDSRSMYRFTAELEFYTRDTEYMNGVASCLLDKLMGLLDCTYQERGGYEATGDDIDGLTAIRIIKNVVINMPYDKPEKLEWVGKWLEEWLKFREVGVLENIGTKDGKA